MNRAALEPGRLLWQLGRHAAGDSGCRSSVVEHSLGKGEVDSSILSGSTSQSLWLANGLARSIACERPDFHTGTSHMALTMARPFKDTIGTYYLRQRTPRELLSRLRGTPVTLPVGDGFVTVKIGDTVQASLRTRDPTTARSRHATADATLRGFWEANRRGPIELTHRQAAALSGELYRAWAAKIEPRLSRWSKRQKEAGRASKNHLKSARRRPKQSSGCGSGSARMPTLRS
jgi:hypothetical protein